ncbi:MAG TPA: MBL fold metallo-hydrolase [Micromonosporaceae bacterium]
MRLTVVGCAGSAPGPDSACSCYLVEADGYNLLLDLGAGAAGPLQRYVAPADVDAVIVSHQHSDHHADLTQLWRLRAVTASPPLPVIGPSDMPAVLRDAPEAFTATVAEPGQAKTGPVPTRLARVDHGECWATRIGDALCYTADTGPCPAIEELAEGCRVLLAEASGLDRDRPMPGHLTAGDAGRLAARSDARLLILTHLRSWQDHRQLLDEAAAIAGCPVILAHPGLRIAL